MPLVLATLYRSHVMLVPKLSFYLMMRPGWSESWACLLLLLTWLKLKALHRGFRVSWAMFRVSFCADWSFRILKWILWLFFMPLADLGTDCWFSTSHSHESHILQTLLSWHNSTIGSLKSFCFLYSKRHGWSHSVSLSPVLGGDMILGALTGTLWPRDEKNSIAGLAIAGFWATANSLLLLSCGPMR